MPSFLGSSSVAAKAGLSSVSPGSAPARGNTVTSMGLAAGLSPRIVQEASSWPSVIGMVEAGLGLTLAPLSAKALRSRGVVFRSPPVSMGRLSSPCSRTPAAISFRWRGSAAERRVTCEGLSSRVAAGRVFLGWIGFGLPRHPMESPR
ncbi:hypothetical protein JY651_48170 [Pyxidicoccus parkwayensis]|uniref:LysR substrate-binding domain-containing protein n=1 Tax=Pyxidicoccus parkwayensis TaxID=2813578 RepID=A0ABX7NZ84_9BACT|nr:LysR substrate-binding domain-containing protein [Pyxidicoccus parkwaysis]QSQ22792.1 hypothetical protein JY651_48170 [Pyxidicoccus parkwaysis]